MDGGIGLDNCKVFVGGLSWETGEGRLRAYFENFGEVLEAWLSYDRQTDRPRGFGFVTFASPAVAERVCSTQHTIDRREVETKTAVPRDEHVTVRLPSIAGSGRKFFVGGLPPSVDEPVFKGHFERFGEVEDAVVMYDHDNKRPRGFGFITYATDNGVAALKAAGSMQTLHDVPIDIKPAVPPEQVETAVPRDDYVMGHFERFGEVEDAVVEDDRDNNRSWGSGFITLRAYFENFGEVLEAWLSYDRQTNRPRGFGFVTFASPAVAERVCSTQHTIDRREVEAKPAVPRDEHAMVRQPSTAGSGRKFFIGGLPPSVDEPVFRRHFERFGEVEDAVVMYDHDNKRPRGFGFITYATDDGVAALKAAGSMQTLHDKPIEIKPAVPPEQMPALRAVGAGRGRGGAFAPQGNGYFGAPAARPQAYVPLQGTAAYPEALPGRGYGSGLAGGGLGPLGALGGTRLGELGYGGHAGAAQGAVSQAAAGGGLYGGGGGGALLDRGAGLGLGLGGQGFSMGSLQGALPQAQPPGAPTGLEDAYGGAFGAGRAHAPSAPAYHAGLPPLGGVDGGGYSYGAGELGGGGNSAGGVAGGNNGVPDAHAPHVHGANAYNGDHGAAFRAEGSGGLAHELGPAPPHSHGAFTRGFHELGLGQQW
ncbi:hypothetical protein WJX81_008271 [Elliptochloris bilobata]|uniref:RRM domain-containing protein n=1 Tax=Elliptochloris bilobata TaxID=381761 RepID=A0AAW1RUX0_9CHLO